MKKKFEYMGLTRPSQFLRAMAEGLKDVRDGRYGPDQKLCMDTFGHVDEGGVCCGCAATWAIQRIWGRRMESGDIDAMDRWESHPLQEDVESALDMARGGVLRPLCMLCRLSDEDAGEVDSRWSFQWRMHSLNWEGMLPALERAVAEMEEEGF